MRYKDSLLYVSLVQVPGVGAKQEQRYWENGIITLQDLADSMEKWTASVRRCNADGVKALIREGSKDIARIVEAFEKRSGKRDYYRIAYSIPDDVMFLDIETTGLSTEYHYVTMVGWMMRGKYRYWLAGKFCEAFNRAKMIVTFNGTKFDCNFLDRLFPNLKVKEKPI